MPNFALVSYVRRMSMTAGAAVFAMLCGIVLMGG